MVTSISCISFVGFRISQGKLIKPMKESDFAVVSAPPYLALGKGHFTSLYLMKLLFCLLETFLARGRWVLFYPKYLVIS
jgi:hypothetical protein